MHPWGKPKAPWTTTDSQNDIAEDQRSRIYLFPVLGGDSLRLLRFHKTRLAVAEDVHLQSLPPRILRILQALSQEGDGATAEAALLQVG